MNNYQRPETTVIELRLEEGTLVTTSLEQMSIINDDWEDE